MAIAEIELTQSDLRRIEKLAQEAGRTPKSMLKFVLRDGFAETERVLAAVRQGRAAAAEGKITSHTEVMRQARATISRHAGRQKRLDWADTARDEFLAGLGLIATDSPANAALVQSRIERSAELLRQHPQLGKPGAVRGTREHAIPNTLYPDLR